MDTLDIRDRKIIVAGAGKVGGAIIDNFSCDFNNILVGNSTGNYKGHQAYKIGELDKILDISEGSIGIIASVGGGVEKALEDFGSKNIPTVLLSTAYREELLNKYTNVPILKAPNLALPIVELIAIFEAFTDFSLMRMEIHESHQPGKQDASGTARKIIKIINEKGGDFDFQSCNSYNPNEGISNFGDLISYRGNASKRLGVPDQHIKGGHGYHTYDRIFGQGKNYEEFKRKIEAWYNKHKDSNLTGFKAGLNFKRNYFNFFHNVDGREIYADGLREILPWFLEQEAGIHEVTDYLKNNKDV